MAVTRADYGDSETAWCPGCGNFAILEAVKRALVARQLAPHEVLFVSGIGQAAKAPHYLRANLFNGLHGRVLPVATGAKLANPQLVVIGESGDGCCYGEGGNHLLAAIRRNIDVTLLVHDNRVYGLTKGQASPTSPAGFITKAQPQGVTAAPFRPIEMAVALGASFVARGFSGQTEHLMGLIAAAIAHPGFALVEIMQPCVSFNRVHTFKWYQEHSYVLGPEYDPGDRAAALALVAAEQAAGEERLALGVIWRREGPTYGERFAALRAATLIARPVDRRALRDVLATYG